MTIALPFIDVVQLLIMALAALATIILFLTCAAEWRSSGQTSQSAFRTSVSCVALLLVEAGSMATLAGKIGWAAPRGWTEFIALAGRAALLTLVLWLAWVKWEEYQTWRTRT
jgi:hypothetical protein